MGERVGHRRRHVHIRLIQIAVTHVKHPRFQQRLHIGVRQRIGRGDRRDTGIALPGLKLLLKVAGQSAEFQGAVDNWGIALLAFRQPKPTRTEIDISQLLGVNLVIYQASIPER